MNTERKLLNIACGTSFIASNEWSNVDFSPKAETIIQANVLKEIPFKDNEFDAVYCSHFFEHIPLEKNAYFLSECLRVLKHDGIIRLVMPDCQEMFQRYLDLRSSGRNDEADFLITEIIDQSTRKQTGGELLKFYQYKSRLTSQKEREYWRKFVYERNGEDLDSESIENSKKPQDMSYTQQYGHFFPKPSKIARILRKTVHSVGILLLQQDFKDHNVLNCAIGESHTWLWDFYQVKRKLEGAGFRFVEKLDHRSTKLDNSPFLELDLDVNGQRRKGAESMYIEAVK